MTSTEIVEAEVIADYDTAHGRTARIKELLGVAQGTLDQVQMEIASAYRERDWEALGYECWADYVTAEYELAKVRLPRADRKSIAASLKANGMSTRAIASALGVSQSTARREVSDEPGESDDSGEFVQGEDGKTYGQVHATIKGVRQANAALAKAVKAFDHLDEEQISTVIEHLNGIVTSLRTLKELTEP